MIPEKPASAGVFAPFEQSTRNFSTDYHEIPIPKATYRSDLVHFHVTPYDFVLGHTSR